MRKSPFAMIVAGTLIQLSLGCLYAWSIFSLLLSEVFPQLTSTQLSLNFTIAIFMYCIGGYVGGRLSARITRKACLRLAAALISVGLFGSSCMEWLPDWQALLLLYVSFGVLMSLGNGLAYNICVTGISIWFPRRMGLVNGILLMSYGVGSLLLGLLIQTLAIWINVFSIFRLFAVGSLAIILPASCFVCNGTPLRSVAPTEKPLAPEAEERGNSPAQMLRRPSFWIFFLICIANSTAGLLIFGNAANIAVWFGASASIGLAASFFNSLSRPVSGIILDRLTPYHMLCLTVCLRLFASLMLVFAATIRSAEIGCIGVFCIGFCYGSSVTTGTNAVREFYGPKHFSVNYSIATFCMLPGSILGPLVSGILQDQSGGFGNTFVMMAYIDACAAILLFFMRYHLHKERRAVAENHVNIT